MANNRIGSLLFAVFSGGVCAWLLLLAASAAAAPTGGITRFVAPTGSDAANNCSSSGAPCQTVARAIEVADPGDEVRVATGVYTTPMTGPGLAGQVTATVILTKDLAALLGGYSIDFSARDVDAHPTVLSATATPYSFVLIAFSVNTTIDGFTLTGARGACLADCSTFAYIGGAVRVQGGAPTFSHNRFVDNLSYFFGGGIYGAGGANLTIVANTFVSNTASSFGLGNGGALYIQSGSAVISGNVILSNVAEVEGGGIFVDWNVPAEIAYNTIAYNQVVSSTAGRGGGVRAIGDSDTILIHHNEVYSNVTAWAGAGGLDLDRPAVVDSNAIHHNRANAWGGGLFIYSEAYPVTVTNNLIVDNWGAAVDLVSVSQAHIANNTVAGQHTVFFGTFGDGLLIYFEITPTQPITYTLINNIVAGNESCGVNIIRAPGVAVDYNDVWDNGVDYCSLANPPSGAHNISADPLFVNAAGGDYHLTFGSPAVNAGTLAGAPLLDFDGLSRPLGLRVDMGAYEFPLLDMFLPLLMK